MMRRLFLAGWVIILALPTLAPVLAQGPRPEEAALSPAEWSAIKRIVGDQLEALRAGDGERAFLYAAPGIRTQFATADNFMRMVRLGYAALLDADSTELLQGAVIGGDVIQPLRLVLPDNTVLVALYTMERQPDGGWRISGCVIAPSTLRAA